jgi:hypothetical protein
MQVDSLCLILFIQNIQELDQISMESPDLYLSATHYYYRVPFRVLFRVRVSGIFIPPRHRHKVLSAFPQLRKLIREFNRGAQIEDVPVFESPPLHTVRPSAPPDSGITLNPQPAAGIAHALPLFC